MDKTKCVNKAGTMSKIKWTKKWPSEDNRWYWVRYKNKNNRYTICPGSLMFLQEPVVTSARNDFFVKGVDKDISFGPKILWPEEAVGVSPEDILHLVSEGAKKWADVVARNKKIGNNQGRKLAAMAMATYLTIEGEIQNRLNRR